MNDLTSEGRQKLEALAQRHGVGMDAAMTLLRAVASGGGRMAQFSHPELGGMGQWSPGMTMVGDMFNSSLKSRVEALCADLASMVREGGNFAAGSSAGSSQTQLQGGSETGMAFSADAWWPASLGVPGSSGGQNDMRYAYFPASRRLAVQQGGRVGLYDTGEAEIFGASQQQGGGQSLSFSTNAGTRQLSDFTPVDPDDAPAKAQPKSQGPAPQAAKSTGAGDPLAAIAGLAELHAKGVLTAEEFASKKAELLARL